MLLNDVYSLIVLLNKRNIVIYVLICFNFDFFLNTLMPMWHASTKLGRFLLLHVLIKESTSCLGIGKVLSSCAASFPEIIAHKTASK